MFIAATGSAAWGAFLLFCYSLGLGVPFIAIGLGAQWLTSSTGGCGGTTRRSPWRPGSILVVVGVLIATGEFTRRLAPLVRYGPVAVTASMPPYGRL